MSSCVGMATRPGAPPAVAATSGAGERPRALAPDLRALYDEHFAFVWRSVRRLGVDSGSVDDLVQEVFLTVHRRLGSFEARSSVRTWLFGIALGIVRNHRRARRRRDAALPVAANRADIETLASSSERAPDARAQQAEAMRLLYRILDELDDDERELFVLAELEAMPAPEIAEALGINVNTVYSRLRAARQSFEAAVGRHRARDGWRLR